MHQTNLLIVGLFILLLTSIFSSVNSSSTSWINAAGGMWNNSSNWNSGVPGSSDTAIISIATTGSIIAPSSVDVNMLQVSSSVTVVFESTAIATTGKTLQF